MSTFDDYEPEDAWDALDTAREHIHNLVERLELLVDHIVIPRTGPIDENFDPSDVLDEIEARVLLIERVRIVDEHDADRIRLIVVDIFFIRQQLS